jgi:FAD synthase
MPSRLFMSLAQPRSTLKDYDLAIYIGRFQPFHKGHRHVLRRP